MVKTSAKKDPHLKTVSYESTAEQFSPKTTKRPKLEANILVNKGMLGIVLVLCSIILYQFFNARTDGDTTTDTKFINLERINNQSFKTLDYYTSIKAKKISVSGSSNIYGALDVEDSHLKDVNIYGSLTAKNSYFQDANIYGFAVLSSSRFRDLEVYGPLSANKLIVEGDVFVASTVNLHHAQLNRMECTGSDINLHNTTVKKITVNGTDTNNPTIHLTDSKVEQINFDGMAGDVILYGNHSEILTVKGGSVIYKNLRAIEEK